MIPFAGGFNSDPERNLVAAGIKVKPRGILLIDEQSSPVGGVCVRSASTAFAPVKARPLIGYLTANPDSTDDQPQVHGFAGVIAIAVKDGIIQSFPRHELNREALFRKAPLLEPAAEFLTGGIYLRQGRTNVLFEQVRGRGREAVHNSTPSRTVSSCSDPWGAISPATIGTISARGITRRSKHAAARRAMPSSGLPLVSIRPSE